MLRIIALSFLVIAQATALAACPPTSQVGCNVTTAKQSAQCGYAGYLADASTLAYTPCVTSTFETCRDNCLSDSTCKSFAWSGNLNDPYCYMFSKVTADMDLVQDGDFPEHYDRSCFVSTCPIVRNSGFEMGPIQESYDAQDYPAGRWYHDPNIANTAVCNRFTPPSNRTYYFDCHGNGHVQPTPCKNMTAPFTDGGDYVMQCLMYPHGFTTVSQRVTGLLAKTKYQITFALAFVNTNSASDSWSMQLGPFTIVKLSDPCSLQGGKLCSSPNSTTLLWQRWTANFTTYEYKPTGYYATLQANSGNDYDGADFYLDNVQITRV